MITINNIKSIFTCLLLAVIFTAIISVSSAAPSKENATSSNEKRFIVYYKDKVTDKDINGLKNSGAEIIYRYKLIPAVAVSVKEDYSAKLQSYKKLNKKIQLKVCYQAKYC